MLFHTWQFFFLFLLIFTVYWQLDHRRQNGWLLITSYVFYAWWDWRFLSLIWLSTLVDYISSQNIGASSNSQIRRRWLVVSIITNLGLLGLFKYFDFFSQGFTTLVNSLGWQVQPYLLHLILPVGISFYSFQTLSYVIDVYRHNLPPAKSLVNFALFVSFFPQLIAGPIERAGRLLPQIERPRHLNRVAINNGLWLFFFGLWLKVFVADGLASVVEPLFDNSANFSATNTVIAMWAFTWQIFADFAGYSSMAQGLASLLGFNLMVNFNLPFWSQNVSEFWQRWHISLSNWVRDYLYIPLGGNRLGNFKTYRNLFLTMIIMGLWHGAQSTFVIWGVYWGIILVLYHWYRQSKWSARIIKIFNLFGKRSRWYISTIITFNVVAFSMIYFRAESLTMAHQMIGALSYFNPPLSTSDITHFLEFFSRVILLILLSIYMYQKNDLLAVNKLPNMVKAPIVAIMLYGIMFYSRAGSSFIYFAF